MNHTNLINILQNAPLPVNFAGLRGTTMSMQDNGWALNISADLDQYRRGYRIYLAGEHRTLRLQFISAVHYIDMPNFSSNYRPLEHLTRVETPIKVEHCAENIIVAMSETPKFAAVDFSNPQYAEFSASRINLRECCYFKTFNAESEIFVPEKQIWTIQDMLSETLNIQADKQKEIREKHRKRSFTEDTGQEGLDMSGEKVKLQIVGF